MRPATMRADVATLLSLYTFSSPGSQAALNDGLDTARQVSDLGRFPRTPPRRAPTEAEHRPDHPTTTAGHHYQCGLPVADRLRDVNQIPDEYAWMLQGCCRGADTKAFFPSNGTGVEAAQRICRGCPVQAECLEYALTNRIEQGVWGGASERERRRILRQRRRAGVLPN